MRRPSWIWKGELAALRTQPSHGGCLHAKLRKPRSWRRGVGKLQGADMAFTVVVLPLVIASEVLTGDVSYRELTGEWMAAFHEFFGNFLLMAFLAHGGGVIMFSLLQGRNLAVPMPTGNVAGSGIVTWR